MRPNPDAPASTAPMLAAWMAGETGSKVRLADDDDHDFEVVWIARRVTWPDVARFSETATVSAPAASPVRASAKASVAPSVESSQRHHNARRSRG